MDTVWESITVKGFQSLYDVHIPLGQFTVIVGPSSSGKSAFIRSIKAVTSNTRGQGFVSHGLPGSLVSVKTAAGTTVSWEKNTGVNGYQIISPEGRVEAYTKTNGNVPANVSKSLAVTPVTEHPVWFAGQFDGPYLVGSPGSQVAGILGSLSGVGILRAAAKEGARLSLSENADLKAAQADLERAQEQAKGFAGIKQAKARVDAALESLKAAQQTAARIARLETLVDGIEQAEAALKNIPVDPSVTAGNVAKIQKVFASIRRIEALVENVDKASRAGASALAGQESAVASIKAAQEEYARVLEEAGTCPTCGVQTGKETVNV